MSRLLLFLMRYVYAVLSCAYLFTIGSFTRRHRRLILTICGQFGPRFRNLLKLNDPIVPEIELSQILGVTAPIIVLEPDQRDGNMSHLEVLAVNSLVAFHRPKGIFEIGTFDGRTTVNMAANSCAETVVYTLDLPVSKMNSTALPIDEFDRSYIDKEVSGSRISGHDCVAKIVRLLGDSATFDFSPYSGKVDLVFVDGAHTCEYALNDSEIARRLLAQNPGIILWHDYGNCDGVTAALNRLYSDGGFWGGIRWIKGTSLACLCGVPLR